MINKKGQLGLGDIILWIMIFSLVVVVTFFSFSGELNASVNTGTGLIDAESQLLDFGSVVNYISSPVTNYSILCVSGSKCSDTLQYRKLKPEDFINSLIQLNSPAFTNNNPSLMRSFGFLLQVKPFVSNNGKPFGVGTVGIGFGDETKDKVVLGFGGISGESFVKDELTINGTSYLAWPVQFGAGRGTNFAVIQNAKK